jgi:hypothetical protein
MTTKSKTAPQAPPKTKNTAPATEAAAPVETKADPTPAPIPAPVVAAPKAVERITLKGIPAHQVQEVLTGADFGATVDALLYETVKSIRAGGEVVVAVSERGAVELEAKARLQRGAREAVRAQFVPRYNPMSQSVELTCAYTHASYFPGLDHEDTKRYLITYGQVHDAGDKIISTLDNDTLNTLIKQLLKEREETAKFVRESYGQMAIFAALGQLNELLPIDEDNGYLARLEGERRFWHTAVVLLDSVQVPDDLQWAEVKLREAAARYSDRKALHKRTGTEAPRERRNELADTFKIFAQVADGVIHTSYAAEAEFRKMVREAVEATKQAVEEAMTAQIARYAAEDEAEALRPKVTRHRRSKEEIEAARAEEDAKRELRRQEIEAKKAAKNSVTPGALVGNTPSLPDNTRPTMPPIPMPGQAAPQAPSDGAAN